MDPKIKEALAKEEKREQDNIELIASENFVSKSILELQGSINMPKDTQIKDITVVVLMLIQ